MRIRFDIFAGEIMNFQALKRNLTHQINMIEEKKLQARKQTNASCLGKSKKKLKKNAEELVLWTAQPEELLTSQFNVTVRIINF